MSAEGAAQWECRALRPSDYGSRSSPPSRARLFTAGPSALAQPVPSGSWCKQNNIFMCLGVRRTCKTAVRFFLVAAGLHCVLSVFICGFVDIGVASGLHRVDQITCRQPHGIPLPRPEV